MPLNKLILLIFCVILSVLKSQQSFGIRDSLYKNMPLSKKILWGENGLIRKLDFAPKTRMEDMKLRHKMLKTHQKLGLLTLGMMTYQSYLGMQMVDGGRRYEYSDKHRMLGYSTFLTYMTTASLSIGAPPAFRYSKGVSSIKIHRFLSYIHFAGMVCMPYLGYLTAENIDDDLSNCPNGICSNYSNKAEKAHRLIGNITVATFSLAFLTTLVP